MLILVCRKPCTMTFGRSQTNRAPEPGGYSAVATSPTTRLSEADRHRLLVEWNATHTDFLADKCIHELIEEQVDRTPDAVAAVFDENRITYAELNRNADALASRLRDLGVEPETRVGICMTRSLNLLAALLGILKAGAAYVPMDPAYPRERIEFMLADANAPVLVTETLLAGTIPTGNATVICCDAPNGNSLPAKSAVAPHHLAYVIYTSGSTGNPKGVMVEHRNVVNFFHAMDRALGQEPGVWLAVTSISFDISVLELLWTLTRGFQVVIQPEHGGLTRGQSSFAVATLREGTARSVPEQILRHGVTHLQCTPSQASMLLEDPAALPALRRLRTLLLGGEALSPELVKRLRGCGNVFNMYGPTETTVWSTVHPQVRPDNVVPIGRPIANTEIYILDEQRQPVPIGAKGELYIGGAGVVRGYLNRPELTAERFVPHPFCYQPGTRLYRTGDLARYLPCGNIEFLGRIDHQIKLRGHRIELGEIDTVLRTHPHVRECVTSVWRPGPADERLVSYHVPVNGVRPQPAELRGFLKQKLPDYMVPSAFVVLDALPLTPNGKIDRGALPPPGATAREASAMDDAPAQTELEKTIARIWGECLRVEHAGLHDNFFDLGGHSVLLMQMHARLQEALRTQFPFTRLFQYPTIGSLAQFLSRESSETFPVNHIRNRALRQRQVFGYGASRAIPQAYESLDSSH